MILNEFTGCFTGEAKMDWKLRVFHCGVFRRAERHRQRSQCLFVNFALRGLHYMTNEWGESVTQAPVLTLRPVGTVASFEFGPDRENWVVFVDTPDVVSSPVDGAVRIRHGEHWATVPWFVSVDKAQASWWQHHFMGIYDLMRSPTPMNVLLAELRVVHVFEHFLRPPTQATQGPAAHYKKLIDHDIRCETSLARLADQCGYSVDHLRVLFVQRYGLSPAKYRAGLRMQQAMEEIVRTDRSIKEIARLLAFSQVAHFSAAFGKHFNMTPTQAIARYRLR